MTDDIVARLRLTPVLMRRDSLGQTVIDYEACKKYVNEEGVKLMREAADEIERLRKERDEARRSCCEYAAIIDGADTADGMESGRFYEIAMKYMKDRGWDCFKGDK